MSIPCTEMGRLIDDVPTPECLREKNLSSINLWMCTRHVGLSPSWNPYHTVIIRSLPFSGAAVRASITTQTTTCSASFVVQSRSLCLPPASPHASTPGPSTILVGQCGMSPRGSQGLRTFPPTLKYLTFRQRRVF